MQNYINTYPKRYGYIDRTGKIIIPAIFDYATSFSEGLALISLKKKLGYINKQGKVIISLPDAESAGRFSQGLAGVHWPSGHWQKTGYIDKQGKLVIAANFYRGGEFSDGLALVSLEPDHPAYINTAGQVILKPLLEYMVPGPADDSTKFMHGLAPTQRGAKVGFWNKEGKMVIPPQFDTAASFAEGVARVEVKGKLGFIDTIGKFVIPPKFDTDHDFFRNTTDFSDGLARVLEGFSPNRPKRKWFYINKAGSVVLECADDCSDFSEGLAVAVTNQYRYLDKLGNTAIKQTYDYAEGFSEGLAVVGFN